MILFYATKTEERLVKQVFHLGEYNIASSFRTSEDRVLGAFVYGYYNNILIVPRDGGDEPLSWDVVTNEQVDLSLPHSKRMRSLMEFKQAYDQLDGLELAGSINIYHDPTVNAYGQHYIMRVSMLKALLSNVTGEQIVQSLSSLYPDLEIGKDYKLARFYTTGGLLVQKRAKGDKEWRRSSMMSLLSFITNARN